jgi:putative oxidoreductase
MRDGAILSGRLLIAALFLIEAWLQAADYAAAQGYLVANGIPAWLLPFALAAELGGGLAVALGIFTRLGAAVLAGFCLLTALLVHLDPSRPGEMVHFYKNLAIAGGLLVLVGTGPGAWSLDARRRRL